MTVCGKLRPEFGCLPLSPWVVPLVRTLGKVFGWWSRHVSLTYISALPSAFFTPINFTSVSMVGTALVFTEGKGKCIRKS